MNFVFINFFKLKKIAKYQFNPHSFERHPSCAPLAFEASSVSLASLCVFKFMAPKNAYERLKNALKRDRTVINFFIVYFLDLVRFMDNWPWTIDVHGQINIHLFIGLSPKKSSFIRKFNVFVQINS